MADGSTVDTGLAAEGVAGHVVAGQQLGARLE
jgi:hypothetical protein